MASQNTFGRMRLPKIKKPFPPISLTDVLNNTEPLRSITNANDETVITLMVEAIQTLNVPKKLSRRPKNTNWKTEGF
jgi:hypothetical protein